MQHSGSKRGNLNIKGQPNKPDWEVGPTYEIKKLVGSGSYGAVCEAVHLPTGKKVAIKRIHGIFEDNIDCKRLLREIKILRLLDSDYIVKLFDILEPQDYENFDVLYLVMEFA